MGASLASAWIRFRPDCHELDELADLSLFCGTGLLVSLVLLLAGLNVGLPAS